MAARPDTVKMTGYADAARSAVSEDYYNIMPADTPKKMVTMMMPSPPLLTLPLIKRRDVDALRDVVDARSVARWRVEREMRLRRQIC